MPSIQQLINEVNMIKRNSKDLSSRVKSGSSLLNSRAASIAALTKGSRSGRDAVMAVRAASKSLSEAAMSMNTLSTTCDRCIADLSK